MLKNEEKKEKKIIIKIVNGLEPKFTKKLHYLLKKRFNYLLYSDKNRV